uniref:Small EDRK-rich factor-like N-terminal domain-containing protein n=1 Tax=Colobus angolensis palliatus TaxID=336983 RepID=A0A2K5IS89_COLAP
MSRGNQCELNRKKQSGSVKGKCRDDGLSAAAASKGAQRPSSRSRKRQTRRRRNPSSFVASCPTLLPFTCVTGASPTTVTFPPAILQRVPFVLPSPQVASLPLATPRSGG